jgi:hypothetical protein
MDNTGGVAEDVVAAGVVVGIAEVEVCGDTVRIWA